MTDGRFLLALAMLTSAMAGVGALFAYMHEEEALDMAIGMGTFATCLWIIYWTLPPRRT